MLLPSQYAKGPNVYRYHGLYRVDDVIPFINTKTSFAELHYQLVAWDVDGANDNIQGWIPPIDVPLLHGDNWFPAARLGLPIAIPKKCHQRQTISKDSTKRELHLSKKRPCNEVKDMKKQSSKRPRIIQKDTKKQHKSSQANISKGELIQHDNAELLTTRAVLSTVITLPHKHQDTLHHDDNNFFEQMAAFASCLFSVQNCGQQQTDTRERIIIKIQKHK